MGQRPDRTGNESLELRAREGKEHGASPRNFEFGAQFPDARSQWEYSRAERDTRSLNELD